ncbi:MAG: hypothetical protein KBS52_02615, partial [Clostridiales bacterium]|nr:hypothetical protein [Candidatus Equinaster intestinalis]
YVETWGYESSCFGCSISHNLFDRAYGKTYQIGGFEQIEPGTDTAPPVDKFSLERMPKMEGNIHIQSRGKDFARVHKGCEYRCADYDLKYKYEKEDIESFVKEGFEQNSLFLFGERK